MPFGDLLNWDFLFPQYTDKQREEIRQREEMLQELKKAIQKQEEGNLNDEENLKEEAYYSFMKYYITKNNARKGGRTMIVGDKCGERMCEIIMEAGKIKESQLRETLSLEGYDPCVITANIKKLCDYGDIEFYPVMEVVDNVILRNGGIPNSQETEEER